MKTVAKTIILFLVISLAQSTIFTSCSFAEDIVKDDKKNTLSIFERIWSKECRKGL